MECDAYEKDLIKFAEEYLGHELHDWQKELLRKYQSGERVMYVPKYRNGKYMVQHAILKYEKMLNKEEKKNENYRDVNKNKRE